MPLISQKITLDFLCLKLWMKLSCNDHQNRQQQAKQVNDQKPSLFTVIIGKHISNNERHGKKEYKKDEKRMNSKPYRLKMLWTFLKLDEPPANLIHNRCKVYIIGVAFNVHHRANAMVERERTIGCNNAWVTNKSQHHFKIDDKKEIEFALFAKANDKIVYHEEEDDKWYKKLNRLSGWG